VHRAEAYGQSAIPCEADALRSMSIVDTTPLITVIIPAYNAGEYLRKAVVSILRQTHTNFELIIVDDGSTDGSVEALRGEFTDPRVVWIRQDNLGKSTAINRALEMARGEFYAIQDADDLSYPRRLGRLVEDMRRRPEVAAVFSAYDLILGGHRLAPRGHDKDVEECRTDINEFRMPGHDPTAMFRMSMVRGLRYDVGLEIGQGFDYVLQVGERFPTAATGECLYSYRVHLGSNTRRSPSERERLVGEVVRRACVRRGLGHALPEGRRQEGRWRLRNRDRDNNLAAHFMESVCDLRRAGHFLEAVMVGAACARLHPLDPYYYRAILYAALPRRFVERHRGRGRRSMGQWPEGQGVVTDGVERAPPEEAGPDAKASDGTMPAHGKICAAVGEEGRHG